MCNIGEDDFGDEGAAHAMQPAIDAIKISDLSGDCSRCNAEPIAVKLSFRGAECLNCFLINVRHKFRATLGSSKILPKNANVLLIFDGSPSSVALLDMAYYAQTQNTFKRLHCNLKGIIIDDSYLGQQDSGYLEKLLEIIKRYEISWYYTSLASCAAPCRIFTQSATELQQMYCQEDGKQIEILTRIKSLTSRQDLILNIRKRVIRNAAKHMECPFVFTSEISPDLASIFLTNISLGRGYSTALDIGLVDDRIEEPKLLRPLKDHTEEEIDYYIKHTDLPSVRCRSYGEDEDTMASIQNLTKGFVKNLQQKFPSTVSTVFRTGNKITTINHLQQTDEAKGICQLCHSRFGPDGSKTLFAIEFSKTMSKFAKNGNPDIPNLEENARKQLVRDKNEQLCHACRNILQDVDNPEIILNTLLP